MDDRRLRIYIALGLFTLGLSALGLSFLLFEPLLNSEERAGQTCGDSTYEKQCYNISQDTCLSVWEKFEEPCRDEVRGRLSQNQMTALIGPAVRWCIQKKYDRTVKGMRKMETSEFCRSYINKLDSLSVTN